MNEYVIHTHTHTHTHTECETTLQTSSKNKLEQLGLLKCSSSSYGF
jgi:hypothetical protein